MRVRLLTWTSLAAMLSSLAWLVISYSGERNRIDRSIAEQKENIVGLRAEMRELKGELKALGEEMKALPDSVRMGMMGVATKKARQIAKQEEIADSGIERSRTKIRNLETAREALRKQTGRRATAGAVVFAALISVLFFLRKKTV